MATTTKEANTQHDIGNDVSLGEGSLEIRYKQGDIPEVEELEEKKSQFTYEYIKNKTPAWLSCELRLDDFSIKNQAFAITGYIVLSYKLHSYDIYVNCYLI